jgi:hypothetical protein
MIELYNKSVDQKSSAGESVSQNNMHGSVYAQCVRNLYDAAQILKQTKEEQGVYEDVLKVQQACEAAYHAVLMALDEYLIRREPALPRAKDFSEYKNRLSRTNKVIHRIFLETYDHLYVAGYFHGTQSAKTVMDGFENAQRLINFIKD